MTTEIQVCTGSQYDFDLSELPARRIERNRGFGLAVCAFATPFLIFSLSGSIWAMQSGDWLFPGFGLLLSMIPAAIFCWGLLNLLTVIETTISEGEITETRQNIFRSSTWIEPLQKFILQVKITTSIHNETRRHTYTYHIRLRHTDDLKSISLYNTESPEQLAVKYREYAEQLNVKEDPHIRDFNTDRPIGDPGEYGLKM